MNPSFSDSPQVPPGGPEPTFWQSMVQGWNRFWFSPADPTLLGLIRICCGLLALYTIISYTGDLQEFFGRDAWLKYDLRRQGLKETPIVLEPLHWPEPRALPPNMTPEQQKYAEQYRLKWKQNPPLPFPKSQEEAAAIDRYIQEWNVDPRLAYVQGAPDWSIWFHVTDPDGMLAVHSLFILITFLFTIGFCTRITSVLTWFAAMCYIHRSPITLFGVDTMMLILLIYLMIGPSGAALSVDRLLSRWWRRRRGLPLPVDDRPRPLVSANVAIRLLQIHLCIIYGAAGLAKLQGTSWWNGTAIWGTLANSEFAPMHMEWYMFLLREMTRNLLFLQMFLAAGTYFTLFFEITYPFLIWGKRTRWLLLAMAVVLHGVIGLIMGLKSFALMMLVMNAAFLPPQTVHWLLGLFRRSSPDKGKSKLSGPHLAGMKPAHAEAMVSAHEPGSPSTQVKRKEP